MMHGSLSVCLLAMPLLGVPFVAAGQDIANAAIGKWKTFDDQTGKAMSITEVYRTKTGAIRARIVETLNKPNATCVACPGDKKGKPVAGMVVFWGMRQENGLWGGNGFKPSTGTSFKVKRIRLLENGRKLEITGCKFIFCRTAIWERVK